MKRLGKREGGVLDMWRNDSRLTQKEKGCKVGKKKRRRGTGGTNAANGFTVSTLAKRGITGTSLSLSSEGSRMALYDTF